MSSAALAEPTIIRLLMDRPPALLGGLILISFFVVAIACPWLAPYDPAVNDFGAVLSPPTLSHFLGTDELGRDVLSRALWGARSSLQAGVVATAFAVLVAVPVGLMAGYIGGWASTVVMRVTDALLAFPLLIIAVFLSSISGPSLLVATIAIAAVQIPKLIRITRGEVLVLREEAFVAAAVVDGATDLRVMFGHILPNIMSVLLVQATVILPFAVLAEATLSYLGLGVQPPTPSWGIMLSAAQPYLATAPWLALAPGVAIVAAAISFNLVGDGLRDVLDPRLR